MEFILRSVLKVAFAALVFIGAPSYGAQSSSAENHFALGLSFYQKQQWTDAISEFEKSLKLDSRHAATHLNLGLALVQAGQFGPALAHLRRAQWLQPNLRPASRALSFLEQKKPELFATASDSGFELLRRLVLAKINLDATLGILLFLFVITGWITARYLGIRKLAIKKERPLPATPVFAYVFGIFLFAFTFVAIAKVYDHEVSRGTVVVNETQVRTAPIEESSTIFTLPEGAEVKVDARNGSWLQIEFEDGATGWVSAKSLLTTGGSSEW